MTLSLEGDRARMAAERGTRVEVAFGVTDFLTVEGFDEGGWFSMSEDWGD